MRMVAIPGTEIRTSPIGLGCASLGSRISPRQGRRMLEAAFEQGVSWYDVAPSYGAGRAEEILAPFLAAHRDHLCICSKAGLVPPNNNGLIRLAYDLGRPVVKVARGLMRRFRTIKATRNRRVALTGDFLEASIAASLRRLGTNRLDVFALHDPDPADLDRDDVLRALERILARGDARHLSMAGSLDAALTAAALPMFTFFQIADDPEGRQLSALRQALARPAGFVVHSVLGVGGARDRMISRLRSRPDLAAEAAAAGYAGPPERIATTLLMRRAFAVNPDGVVLSSMFSTGHLTGNLRLAAEPPDPAAARLAEHILSAP
ncbi:aldo/keto reductase [Pleomorphomonas koreensis]|uniref:aldo/keto reductase n=1 Tax=Pleomorphomonas koreensis TaxID=257440 RepID=UPI0003F901AA|nr:aldo/keto reductase [Pleomorphomonas koreensis]